MKKLEVSDNDYVVMISALDVIISDETVQQKIVEAMKIIEKDDDAACILSTTLDDIEDAKDDTDFMKAELLSVLRDIIDVVSYRELYKIAA